MKGLTLLMSALFSFANTTGASIVTPASTTAISRTASTIIHPSAASLNYISPIAYSHSPISTASFYAQPLLPQYTSYGYYPFLSHQSIFGQYPGLVSLPSGLVLQTPTQDATNEVKPQITQQPVSETQPAPPSISPPTQPPPSVPPQSPIVGADRPATTVDDDTVSVEAI